MKRAEFVRHTFFPRWDRKREWQIVEADDLDGAQGKCDLDTKTVSVLRGVGGDARWLSRAKTRRSTCGCDARAQKGRRRVLHPVTTPEPSDEDRLVIELSSEAVI
jgi:hypothetical protein